MFIQFDDIGDRRLIHLPDSARWELRFRLFDDKGNNDYGLYLFLDEEEISVRDTDTLCQGRPELPYTAVGLLYAAIVDRVAERITSDPTLRLIDIDAIEAELLEEKFYQQWLNKGFIQPDANGHW